MSFITAEENSAAEVHVPANIDWEMLDKSKFFFLGAALFSSVSCALYPMIVLKTRQQMLPDKIPCSKIVVSILRNDGYRGFYRGLTTSLIGTIPARALYMGALELTRSNIDSVASGRLGLSKATASAAANAAAGVNAAVAAQLVWNPIDVVSQRLMVQDSCSLSSRRYSGGVDAFVKIVRENGVRGLYRGFGVSLLTCAPSNAAWWATYSAAHRVIWRGFGSGGGSGMAEVAVQGLSATVASGVSALVTMPLDTIKTRTQVMDLRENERGGSTRVVHIMRDMVKEGGLGACYRGLGPRWASMSVSAATMITTYEFVKRLSTKN